MWTDPLPLVVIGIAVAVLAWDVALAGWIAGRRDAPALFVRLTTFCGLMVIPALVVSMAAASESSARTISGVTWIHPVVAAAFVVQVLYSIGARLVSPVVAVPILLYDTMLAIVAAGDYLVATTGTASIGLQAAVAARDAVLGVGVGRAALVSPLTALIPMVAPASPARWRLSGVVRAILVLAATALTTLLVMEWPRGVAAVRSYSAAAIQSIAVRPPDDFRLGMRFLPVIHGFPAARSLRADTAQVNSVAPDILLVVLGENGASNTVLDSLARVLKRVRTNRLTGDTVTVAVGLRPSGSWYLPSARAIRDRTIERELERILLRLKPDVVFPALPEPIPAWLSSSPPSASWWRETLTTSAAVIRRVRPNTLLGWSATRLDATDSSVYAWAAATKSPVSLLGAAVFPGFSGLPGVDARLRAFERWHSAAADSSTGKIHWLTTVGGLPHAHGDAAQAAAIRRSIAWASHRDWIKAVIVGEPGDYDGWVGLRASNGRNRETLNSLRSTSRRIHEASPRSN